ncbi:MAG: BTAD domain-containing putative transcriptional regulator [Deinococcales bacterium]
MAVFVQMLGRPSIARNADARELPVGKTTALLYYLAYHRDWVDRESVMALLYPETEERLARQNLRALLAAVRRVPEAHSVEIQPTRLRWSAATDVAAFLEALAEGRPAAALESYGGPFLDGFVLAASNAFQTWLELERTGLQRRWRDAAMSLASVLLGSGRPREAAGLLERVLECDPLDESALRSRLVALAGGGRATEAVEVYEAFGRRVAHELDVKPDKETQVLVERIRRGETPVLDDLAAGGTGEARTTTGGGPPLPRAVAPFIGRKKELDTLSAYLSTPDCRVITLVGPGGIGKSALALEAGRRAETEGRTVAFVALEHAAGMEAAVALVGAALGLTFFGPVSRRRQLVEWLNGRSLLVILDNVEHLVGISQLVNEIVEGAAGVKLIATSRQRLALRAEWAVDIDGLRCSDGPLHEAARLFDSAARRAYAGFEIARHTEAVDRICRELGGMPLALELAAGWLPVLAPAEIANRLERGLELLRAGGADRHARHGDVRDLLGETWSRLDVAERRAMCGLAVFTGGFTARAAETIAEVDAAMLLRLAGRGLVRRGDGDRYGHHPLVWRYARERASEDPMGWRRLRERHAVHYAERMRTVGALSEERPDEPRPEEAPELPNVLDAWSWMVEARRSDLLSRTVEGLFALALAAQRTPDVAAAVARATDAVGDGSALHGRLLMRLGALRNWSVDFAAAVEPLRRSIELAQRHGEPRVEGLALFYLGLARAYTGAPTDVQRATWERCVALFRAAGDRYHEARALGNLADFEVEPRSREELQRTAVRGFRACSGRFGLTLALMNLAATLRDVHGGYSAARELLDEAVEVERRQGEPFRLSWWLLERATTLLDEGMVDDAEQDVDEAERIADALGTRFGAWERDHALAVRGRLKLARGDPDSASEVLKRAASLASGLPDPFGRAGAARCWWALAEVRAGRLAAGERLASDALATGPSYGLSEEHEWWPHAAVASRVLAEQLAERDGRAALDALSLAGRAVRRLRLLPAALELCLAGARIRRVHNDIDGARALLVVATTHPAASARTREEAGQRLWALGERAPRSTGSEADVVTVSELLAVRDVGGRTRR